MGKGPEPFPPAGNPAGIITDSSSSEEQRLSAQERLLSIMAGSEVETELEGLLMAQGLPDAVVVLSDHGSNRDGGYGLDGRGGCSHRRYCQRHDGHITGEN